MTTLDSETRAIIRQIESLGFCVGITTTPDEKTTVAATSHDKGAVEWTEADPYLAVCKVAQIVGIDLEG